MDVSDVTPQLEQLEEELSKAQDTLKPLLGDIGDISNKLPLLDKAKLYVLVAYTIESLLFCETRHLLPSPHPLTPGVAALRLNGVETKNHAIFTELTRVKQYVEKIQKLETPAPARETAVNTEVAARFIKADLVSLPCCLVTMHGTHASQGDNKEIKEKLSELIANERAKAAAKATEKKRPAEESTAEKGAAQDGGNLPKRPKRNASKKKK